MFLPSCKKAFAVLALAGLLSACGGSSGGAGGDQSPLPVCQGNDIVLANGQCGPPPPVECELPEVAVGGRCIVPDKPAPKYSPGPNEAVIYYNRRDQNFDGWVLHLWNSGCEAGSWDAERVTLRGPDGAVDYSYDGTGTSWPAGPTANHQYYADGEIDPIYGAYWVLQLQENAVCGNFIVHGPTGPPQTLDLRINFTEDSSNPYRNMYWVVVDSTLAENELREAKVAAEPICINDVCQRFEPPPLAVEDQAAHWIDANTIVWNRALSEVALYSSASGELEVAAEEQPDGSVRGVVTGELAAALVPATLTDAQRAKVPHLAEYSAYSLNLEAERAKELLTHQLWIVGEDAEGNQYGTQLQLARVLDDLYAETAADAALGPVYEGSDIRVSVWAPTAQQVQLRLYERQADGRLTFGADLPMNRDGDTGVWSLRGAASDWDRQYYRFLVTAYHPAEFKVLTLEARDPYSTGAYTSSLASQFVNLEDEELKPTGWDSHAVPPGGSPEGAVIYEGHVRDFSARDESTPAEHRGKYLAFTAEDSAPVRHLRELAAAGLTHFHVLPAFDVRSINEDPARQVNLDNTIYELCRLDDSNEELCPGDVFDRTAIIDKLNALDPTTGEARRIIDAIKDLDGFNWGYDPVLYNVPEGSYATDPTGPARVREMRAMFQALHEMGLRVVLDVVYNHTSDEGADGLFSVFDRIVPGYYYRRNATTGGIERASCCSDTAAEKAMMGKFIKDSAVFWATQYKVDGFRFDWMSLHPKSLMEETLAAVRAVDSDTYIYGEGWPPGSGSADATFELASQANMAGTGIGTFNDRMRDRLRDLSLSSGGDLTRIRAGLAGNLAEYQLVLNSGLTVQAASEGGYTADPQESVNYASVHDGMTLWDQFNQGGVLPDGADTATADRVRMASQAQSLVLLSQGVPFVHMGGDILRSKSLSGNSYNAGDWFNYLDFSLQTNNWNVGLPPEGPDDDSARAAVADANAKPMPEHLAAASAMFREFLGVAQGSPLFSLGSAAEVMDRVGFHNVGRGAQSNLIAMSIDDGAGLVTNTEEVQRADLDSAYDAILVVFNGAAEERSIEIRTATGFALHPRQRQSADERVRRASFTATEGGGLFTVPALTTAVFVKAQGDAQGEGLSAFVTSGFEPPVPYGDTPIHLRGQFNGWGTTPMSYVGNGQYEGYLELDAGDYAFKIASEDWSTVDIAAPEGQSEVALGQPAVLSDAGQLPNLTLSIPQDGEYRFALDTLNSKTPVLTVTDARAFPAVVFVRGAFNGWGTDNPLVYVGRGLYQATLPVPAGEHAFKVASEDWSTVDLSVPGDGAVPVDLNAAISLSGPRNPNMQISVPADGDYLFTLAAGAFSSSEAGGQGGVTLWVAPAEPYAGTPIYLRGSFNSWGTSNEMAFQARAFYRADLMLAPDAYAFKVASEDWSTVNIGGGDSSTVEVGVPLAVVDGPGTPNLSVVIAEEDTYAFTVDLSQDGPVLQVRKSADVPVVTTEPPPPPALVEPLDFDAADGAYAFMDDALVTTVVVMDPLREDGDLTSVASTMRAVGAAADAGTAYELDGAIAFAEDLDHLAVDVYAAGKGMATVAVIVSDSAGGASMTATAEYAGSGAWETLHFNFSAFDEAVQYVSLKIIFDQGNEGDGATWHWDNVRLSAAPPGTRPPYGDTAVYVRGLAGDWGTSSPLAYLGGGLYQADLALALPEGGAHAFKVASEDWATVNFGAASADRTAIELNQERVLATPGENFALTLEQAGSHRFRLDASDAEAPVLKVISLAGAPYGHGEPQSPIYVRGAFNDWGAVDELHYAGAGAYEAVVAIAQEGAQAFKVASEDWARVNMGAADAGAAAVTLGTAFAGFQGGADANLTLNVPAPGDYLFTLDASEDADSPSLWVAPFKPFGDDPTFVRGGMNGWGTDHPLSFKGRARYAADIELTADTHQFKVATEDWSTVNLGAEDEATGEVVLGEPFSGLVQDGQVNLSVSIEDAGAYSFQLDGSRSVPPTLRVQPKAD